MFITFEGIDGSGKSTQILRLQSWLNGLDYDVLVSREPGGTQLGDAIRNILLDTRWQEMTSLAELLLYSASRAQLVEQVIKPHLLKAKAVVILDRYADSSTAYQGGGRRLGVKLVETVNRHVTGKLEPDLTFYLDLAWATSLRRRGHTETKGSRRAAKGTKELTRQHPPDRLEQNSTEFFARVRETYLELCKLYPERIVLIDGGLDEDAVFDAIRHTIEKRILASTGATRS